MSISELISHLRVHQIEILKDDRDFMQDFQKGRAAGLDLAITAIEHHFAAILRQSKMVENEMIQHEVAA
jgi:hypothetical protein